MKVVVIAMEKEAEAVKAAFGDGFKTIVCGIGKVNAAAAAQQAIDMGADEVLNCGLCGGLDPQMKVGDVYEVESAVEYDFDLAQINGTSPGVLNEKDTPYLAAFPTSVYPSRILASGDRFTDSDADFRLLDALKCTLKDMEGAAIAHVCEKNSVKFRSLKAVSDVRGLGSMPGQYMRNMSIALEALSAAASRWAGLVR